MPNEKAYLQMGALDDLGHTLCNVELALEITAPDGTKNVFKTPSSEEETISPTQTEEIKTEPTSTSTPTPEESSPPEESPLPEISPTLNPEVTPEITPEEVPEQTPESNPEITPEATPKPTPEAAIEPTPEVTPENPAIQNEPTSFWNKIKNTFAISTAKAMNDDNISLVGVIEQSKECGPDTVTYTPDYYTYYNVGEKGIYQIKLTAITQNGTREITDSFEVRESVPFDIERIGPTRIYPPADYEIKLKIKPKENFVGQVLETVPLNFEIIADGAEQKTNEEKNIKEIIWQVDWKAGEVYELKYQFDAPNISPDIYLLGPLSFQGETPVTDPIGETKELLNSNQLSFQEIRQWQIVSDAITPNAAVDASASAQSENVDGEGRKLVFISDTTGYLFYTDGTGIVGYSKTTNGGLNWSAAVVLTAQTDCENFGVWYDGWTPGNTDGGLIHVAFLENGTDDIYYEYVDTKNADVQKGEVLAVDRTVTSTHTALTDSVSITRATNGDLYIAASSSVASSTAVVRKSTNLSLGTVWSDVAAEGLDDATLDPIMLMPLANDDVMLLRWDISADDVQSKEFEDVGNTWDANWTDVDTNAVDDTTATWTETWSATINPDTYDIYLAYVDNAGTASATPDIRTATYNGSSWTAKTNVLTDTNTILGTAIALDTLTDTVYVAYLRGTTTVSAAYYKMSTDSMATWSVERGKPLAIVATNMRGIQANLASTYQIGIWAFDDTLSDIWYSTLDDIGNPSGAIFFVQGTTTGANFQGFESQDSVDADATAGTFLYSTTTFRSGLAALRTYPTVATGYVTHSLQYANTGAVSTTDIDNCDAVVAFQVSSSVAPNQQMSIIRLSGGRYGRDQYRPECQPDLEYHQ